MNEKLFDILCNKLFENKRASTPFATGKENFDGTFDGFMWHLFEAMLIWLTLNSYVHVILLNKLYHLSMAGTFLTDIYLACYSTKKYGMTHHD